jgi:hypothetical protein
VNVDRQTGDASDTTHATLSQVIATGTACPTPNLQASVATAQVMVCYLFFKFILFCFPADCKEFTNIAHYYHCCTYKWNEITTIVEFNIGNNTSMFFE